MSTEVRSSGGDSFEGTAMTSLVSDVVILSFSDKFTTILETGLVSELFPFSII